VSDVAIRIEGLGKRYRIGAASAPYRSLRESLMESLSAPLRRLRREARADGAETLWALRNVSLEVRQGEVVGVIGRNGAGKSTLLKILSRITEPTEGYVDVHGRVGSLLEVGTGFHPELTGRENVFLNGSILGMRRAEIERKFDEIAAFAEIEKFLDTPVKHYSSGMYMRLAFSVAAHLDPEILVVDEVLAVGDAAFQKKCLGKMDEVARQGRTVLFVAHNLGAIGQLCETGALLHEGELVYRGSAASTIHRYLTTSISEQGATRSFPVDPAKAIQVLEVSVRDAAGAVRDRFDLNDPVHLSVRYAVHDPMRGMNVCLILHRNGMPLLCSLDTDAFPAKLESREAGVFSYSVKIPPRFLKAGIYSLSVDTGKTNQGLFEKHNDVVSFQVEELTEDTAFRGYAENRLGMVVAPLEWSDEGACAG